jgi:tetratricopeptide (TPR) repeat protein
MKINYLFIPLTALTLISLALPIYADDIDFDWDYKEQMGAALTPQQSNLQTSNRFKNKDDSTLRYIKAEKPKAKTFYNQALNNYKKNDFENSISKCNQALQTDPNFADAYKLRGDVYSKLNNHNEAIADYNQALRINPKFADAYFSRANEYFELRENEKAMADYNQTLQIDPNYARAYYGRGTIYVELKNDLRAAIAEFNQALRINPKYANAYYTRGLVRETFGERQEAIADIQKAVDLYKQERNIEWYQHALELVEALRNGSRVNEITIEGH